MIFNSIQFYIFLIITFILYYIVKDKYRFIILLIASYYFYCSSNFKNVIILLLVTIISYISGLIVDKSNNIKKKKITIAITTILLISLLLYFKYSYFILQNINIVLSKNFSIENIVVPLGISFFTLQAISYPIDIYRKDVKVERDAIDKMRFSSNKVDAIKNSVENEEDRMSYYLNIIKYHSRYKEIDVADIKTAFFGYTIDNKGYIALEETGYVFDNTNELTNNEIEIYKKNIEYLNKIINLAKEENIKLIIVKTPTSYGKEDMARLNYVKRVANENDILFLDYMNDMDDLNLDYSKDFYDAGHLNKNGSIKFTNKFTEIIKQM